MKTWTLTCLLSGLLIGGLGCGNAGSSHAPEAPAQAASATPPAASAPKEQPAASAAAPEAPSPAASSADALAVPPPAEGQVGRGLPPAAALPSPTPARLASPPEIAERFRGLSPGHASHVTGPNEAAGAPGSVAGYIFNHVPVPLGNYYFAKRVSYMFPHPWEEGASAADRERFIWEALILNYESFRRGIAVSEDELEKRINNVLKGQKQDFTRTQNRDAYATWVKETLNEDVDLFENQMKYLLQIDKLKDQVRTSMQVTVTDAEMQQEFLNEQNHVGGEMVVFDTQAEAQAMYNEVKDPARWDAMKAKGERKVRPVSLMTLEAYMDLWSIPKDQMYAFHAMAIGAIGSPMPFGKQWCVYRLLEKRTGDLADFPKQRDSYYQQIQTKKQYEALKKWIEDFKASAQLAVLPVASEPSAR